MGITGAISCSQTDRTTDCCKQCYTISSIRAYCIEMIVCFPVFCFIIDSFLMQDIYPAQRTEIRGQGRGSESSMSLEIEEVSLREGESERGWKGRGVSERVGKEGV